jgi:methionyl-tRNA synthetase
MEDFLNQGPWVFSLFFGLIIWSFVWKGLALWQSARNGHKGWFVALLLINTIGILEILYVYVFGKNKTSI